MAALLEPQQVGKREDLADIMAIVDLKATPFTSRIRKSPKATNTLFEWLVDAYDAVQQPTDGIVDGTDVSTYENHAVNRARLKSHVQMKRRTARVSRMAENVSETAGVSDEIAQATEKKTVELKRDIEAALLGGQDAQADNGAVPYVTCGLDRWISTTGPALYTVPTQYKPAAAQINSTAVASLTEDGDVQAVLQAIFDATGMTGEYVLFAGSTLRRRFTDMTRTIANATSTATKVRTFQYTGAVDKVSSTTTIFQGDYGTLEVESCSFIGVDTAGAPDKLRGYLCDMDKLRLRFNKMPAAERFPDLGGGQRVNIECIFGLQVDNPIGMAKFRGGGTGLA